MKYPSLSGLVVAAAVGGCMPSIQVAQNPVQKGPFTVRVGSSMDTRCMLATSSARPIHVWSFVLKAWKPPSDMCPDLDGDGFCESTKEVGKHFYLTSGREQYFADCTLMPEAQGWDFEVFYEESDVGAETVPFSRDAAVNRPPPPSVEPRVAPRPSEPAPPAPTPEPPAPDPAATPSTPPPVLPSP